MKKLIAIILILLSNYIYSQDSVKAKVIRTAEKTLVFKANGYRLISYDCRCDSLKRGMEFKIPKQRFDSLLLEAKPIRKKDIEN